MVNLAVQIAGVKMKNPVTVGAGTISMDYQAVYDLNVMGAYVPKTIRNYPWRGNPPPRIMELPAGILSSVGIPSKSWEDFLLYDVPTLREMTTPVIMSVVGRSVAEYAEIIGKVSDLGFAAALELNLSCPNVKAGGAQFGSDTGAAAEIVRAGKEKTSLPLIPKLPPDPANIVAVARAVEAAGADAVSLINAPKGMRIDLKTRRPYLGNKVGGVSGPCIKPFAINMVYEVYENVGIPIIGMGGMSNALDVVEMMLAGATAVAIGSANFFEPLAVPRAIEDLAAWLEAQGIEDVNSLIGQAHQE